MSADAPRSSEEDIVEGMTIGDHFLITRKLGAGGMGEVYLAENLNLPDIRYAIKVLRKELTAIEHYARLLDGEAKKQASLDHPNVVKLFDYFPWRQRYCLVLAFVDGTTLADMIEAEPGGLQEARALDLMLDILAGVNHAHEHGVLHCDIKPANVLVDVEHRARVTDFGIARDIGPVATHAHGVVIGTPEYMSPEQISDPDHVDHRTDVYSAGVVLFEMLTGRLPFAHENEPGGVRFPQLSIEPSDIRDHRKDLSPDLSRIVATALQRDPAARFQGGMDFQQAIIRYRQKQHWRRTWLPAIVVVSVLALAGAVGSYLWNRAVEDEALRVKQIAKAQTQANLAQARKTIEASIATAIKQLGSLCRESTRLETRQKVLATAADAGFADLVAKFRGQIEDMRKNMSDYSHGYAEALGQLVKFDPPVVKELIEAHPQQDQESPRFLQAVRSDHAALSQQRPMRTSRELLSTCPK